MKLLGVGYPEEAAAEFQTQQPNDFMEVLDQLQKL